MSSVDLTGDATDGADPTAASGSANTDQGDSQSLSTTRRRGPGPDGIASDAKPREVQRAFALGWQMAQLFHEPVHKGETGPPSLEKQLPGMSGLSRAERSVLLARQIGALTDCLISDEDDVAADVAEVLGALRQPDRHSNYVRETVLHLHVGLLEALTVRDFRLGKAYGLGRALAETVLIPTQRGLDSQARAVAYREMFEPGRIATIDAWLQQLKSDFPAHGSYAVHGSLDRWQEWVNGTEAIARLRADEADRRAQEAQETVTALTKDSKADPAEIDKAKAELARATATVAQARKHFADATEASAKEKPARHTVFQDGQAERDTAPGPLSRTLQVRAKLLDQGKVWRGILSGEVIPADLLDVESYLEGGAAMVDRLRHLIWRFLRKYSWVVAVVFAVAALVVVLLWVLPSYATSNKIATEIAAVAATLGLSVKGVTSTLGRTVTEAEAPLWESELDESCAVAATKMPENIPVSRHSSLDVGKIH